MRENSQCCGAGGGVKAAFSDVASNIGVSRMEEATKTKSGPISSQLLVLLS
jgi:heterodisulfide reductase subunit D